MTPQVRWLFWRPWLLSSVLIMSVVCASWWCGLSWSLLWSSRSSTAVLQVFAGLASPDLSSAFLSRVLRLLGESLAIAILGMGGALLLAIPMALLAARWPQLPDAPQHARALPWSTTGLTTGLAWLARSMLSLWRAIPDLAWAFLFVRIFGLGPAPAVFAIIVSFAGILGKLYAELIEACDPRPARRLYAAGAGTWAVLCFAILPQVRTQWLSYGLFRLECALRSAAILGLVGAGGIGAEISLSLRYYQYDKLATALLVLLTTIVLFEGLSAWLRRRPLTWNVGLIFAAAFCAWWVLPIPWNSLFSPQAWTQLSHFTSSLRSPTSQGSFLWKTLGLMGQTLLMAWSATLLAASAALLLSPWASTRLSGRGTLPDAPQPRSLRQRGLQQLVWPIRFLFQLTRALPDLVWALLFLVWVGPGPLAGILAIATHTFGVLGRLYSDTYDEAERAPLQRLEATGVSRFGRWLFGLWPLTRPRLLAYTLFRFEINVRATAVIGFVGAGGIGDAIHTAISLFHFHDLATLLLVLWLTILGLDRLGYQLRQRWLSFSTTPAL